MRTASGWRNPAQGAARGGRAALRRAWAVIGAIGIVVTVNVGLVLGVLVAPAYAQVQVSPTADGFPGGSMVQKLINWVGQFGLWGSVASLLVGGGIWGVSQQFGNGFQAGKGKMLAAAGAIGAVLTGLAPVIVNTLYEAARV